MGGHFGFRSILNLGSVIGKAGPAVGTVFFAGFGMFLLGIAIVAYGAIKSANAF